MGVPPVIIHFKLGFSLINHPAVGVPGTPIYGNLHIVANSKNHALLQTFSCWSSCFLRSRWISASGLCQEGFNTALWQLSWDTVSFLMGTTTDIWEMGCTCITRQLDLGTWWSTRFWTGRFSHPICHEHNRSYQKVQPPKSASKIFQRSFLHEICPDWLAEVGWIPLVKSAQCWWSLQLLLVTPKFFAC